MPNQISFIRRIVSRKSLPCRRRSIDAVKPARRSVTDSVTLLGSHRSDVLCDAFGVAVIVDWIFSTFVVACVTLNLVRASVVGIVVATVVGVVVLLFRVVVVVVSVAAWRGGEWDALVLWRVLNENSFLNLNWIEIWNKLKKLQEFCNITESKVHKSKGGALFVVYV